MGNVFDKELLPCKDLMNSYVKCMEDHEGVRPDPYEPEWCCESKNLYLDCMSKFKKERQKKRG
jgi:hypothetical protein